MQFNANVFVEKERMLKRYVYICGELLVTSPIIEMTCLDNNGDKIYSDARVLTIYELLIVFSLPTNWNIPDWANDNLIRRVIGEGIPPKLVQNLVRELIKNIS